MRKTKKRCEEALQFYIGEVSRRIPDAVVEAWPDAPGGFDFWADVYVPTRAVASIRRKLTELEDEAYDRFGVSFLSFSASPQR